MSNEDWAESTMTLLALPTSPTDGSDTDTWLEAISDRVVKLAMLRAKAEVYAMRVPAAIISALNSGADPQLVADAAGLPLELVEAATRESCGVELAPEGREVLNTALGRDSGRRPSRWRRLFGRRGVRS